jgi:hypothetical protein
MPGSLPQAPRPHKRIPNYSESHIVDNFLLHPARDVPRVALVNAKSKRVMANVGSEPADNAQRLSVSLYRAHFQTLVQRERELNVGRSTLIQILLEIEQDRGLLLPELQRRLRRPNTATANHPKQKGTV